VCDLICDVITCCVWSYDVGKINVYDSHDWKPAKKRNVEIKETVHKSPSKRRISCVGLIGLSRFSVAHDTTMSEILPCRLNSNIATANKRIVRCFEHNDKRFLRVDTFQIRHRLCPLSGCPLWAFIPTNTLDLMGTVVAPGVTPTGGRRSPTGGWGKCR